MGKKIEQHEIVAKIKEVAKEIGKTPTLLEMKQHISARQIQKYGYNNLVVQAGLTPNETHTPRPELEARPVKILFLDVEISRKIVKTFNMYDTSIPISRLVRDWFLMSWAAAFDKDGEIHYLDQRYANDFMDMRQIIEGIHHLISQADFIVAHNLPFDWGHINTLIVKYDLEPLHPNMICTLAMARKIFKRGITSKKLEFLAKFLDLPPKEKHKKFPGDDLWDECEDGNMEAWEEMELYNKQDVAVLREVFYKLAKYDPSINFSMYSGINECPCGSTKFYRDGVRVTKAGKYQIFKCAECAKFFRSRVNETSAAYKSRVFA